VRVIWSLLSITLNTLVNSFTASLIGELSTLQKNRAREVIVAFQPSHVGNFHAVLGIAFSDKGRANDRGFTVTRELRGRAILPGRPAINGDGPHDLEDVEDGEGTGIDVSHDYGLEFSAERQSPDEPFSTQAKELIITKSSKTPLVTFVTAMVRSPDDPVME
jgi:hypothetical protein